MQYIYLHGFASSPQSRKAQFFRRRFAELDIDLAIPDLAQGDFSHLTISSQLAVIASLLSERVTLIGSSMGGYLAALCASFRPEIARLVLLAPAFGFSSRWGAIAGEDKLEEWQRTGWVDVFHYGDRAPRQLHYGLCTDALQYPGNPDFSQPALIFHGRGDSVVPIEVSRNFAASHLNATLLDLDSDHELLNVLDTIADIAIPFCCRNGDRLAFREV